MNGRGQPNRCQTALPLPILNLAILEYIGSNQLVIALSPVNRELYATLYFLEWIDELNSPLSASQMEYLPQFVHSPYLLKRIQKMNMEFIAYVEAAKTSRDMSPLAGTPASLRVAESELEGLTDGREIFERIIASIPARLLSSTRIPIVSCASPSLSYRRTR